MQTKTSQQTEKSEPRRKVQLCSFKSAQKFYKCHLSCIHVRESTPNECKICSGQSNQGPVSSQIICQSLCLVRAGTSVSREAAGRGGQRGGTATSSFHRLESPSSPVTHTLATILTLLWQNACSKKKKSKPKSLPVL